MFLDFLTSSERIRNKTIIEEFNFKLRMEELELEKLRIKSSKQSGGFIPHTGLYNLHAGETVVPANQSFTSSPTINIYTTGGVDDFTMNRISETILRDLATIQGR